MYAGMSRCVWMQWKYLLSGRLIDAYIDWLIDWLIDALLMNLIIVHKFTK